MLTFTIIDSFRVTDELAPRLDGMSKGCWFVVEGQFSPNSNLPKPGCRAMIQKPSGEKLEVLLSNCELRHGSVALQFTELTNTDIPRFSVVSLSERP